VVTSVAVAAGNGSVALVAGTRHEAAQLRAALSGRTDDDRQAFDLVNFAGLAYRERPVPWTGRPVFYVAVPGDPARLGPDPAARLAQMVRSSPEFEAARNASPNLNLVLVGPGNGTTGLATLAQEFADALREPGMPVWASTHATRFQPSGRLGMFVVERPGTTILWSPHEITTVTEPSAATIATTAAEQRDASGPPMNIVQITPSPVLRRTREPLWRIDDRRPEEIFASGFAPLNPSNLDIDSHVRGDRSGFVSASKDRSLYKTWFGVHGFLYEIDMPGGLDVAEMSELGLSPFGEQEIAFPGRIPGERVRGAYPILADRTLGEFISNDDFYRLAELRQANEFLDTFLPRRQPEAWRDTPSWLERLGSSEPRQRTATIEVNAGNGGGPVHVWVGITPNETVANRLRVSPGHAVVHARGQHGQLRLGDHPLVLSTLLESMDDEGLADEGPIVLLAVEGQESAQDLADRRRANVWVPSHEIWVSASTGAVFIGDAAELPGGLIEPLTAGKLQKFVPDGTAPVIDDEGWPLTVLTPELARTDPGPWVRPGSN
jgi:hypothetical protein